MNDDGVPLHDVRVLEILRSTGADFYGGMLRYLKENHGYAEGRDLFTFPYDWRRSNVFHFTALDQMIDKATAASRQKQVVLLAHSMGGLIARNYVLSRPERAAKVDAVVTMGTPYWGSPKVFYALVAGYTFGNPLVFASTMKVLIQNFPATYQLLPHRPFVWDDRQGRYLTVDETMQIEYERLELVSYAPVAVASGTQRPNPDLFALAQGFHTISGPPTAPKAMPAGVELHTILGVGVRTLDEFALRAPRGREEAIRLGQDAVVLEPLFGDGDGTVPLANLEIANATRRYYLPWRADDSTAHGDLANSTRVQAIVGQIVSGSPAPSTEHPYPFVRPGDRLDPDSGVDFTLRSDAHLQVQNGSRLLGGTDGTITESLPGTFLRLNGVEYAALPVDAALEYDVRVTGITTGSFDLALRRTTAQGTTLIEYPAVAVEDGTEATVKVNPRVPAWSASMEVRTDGRTTRVAPVVRSDTANERDHDGGGAGVAAAIVGIALAAVAAVVVAVVLWRRTHRLPTA